MRLRPRAATLIDLWLLAVLAAYITHRVFGAELFHAVSRAFIR